MRPDVLDMLTMLREAESELGIRFLALRMEATGRPAYRWQYTLADPDAPAGRRVFTISLDCPPQSRFEAVKKRLKQNLRALAADDRAEMSLTGTA